MGPAYLRYAFTKNTSREIDFLVAALGLSQGARVLDVGCGPGRHSLELARRGMEVVGVDISPDFVRLASEAALSDRLDATFVACDARTLADTDLGGPFDVAIAMCQGAFGLQAGPAAGADPPNLGADQRVLDGLAVQLRPGGLAGVAAFSAYFRVRNLDGSEFDALSGTNHEHTEVRASDGRPMAAELWTTCFTPRALWMLAERAGLEPQSVQSVSSVGDYSGTAPDIDEHELFLIAKRPQ